MARKLLSLAFLPDRINGHPQADTKKRSAWRLVFPGLGVEVKKDDRYLRF